MNAYAGPYAWYDRTDGSPDTVAARPGRHHPGVYPGCATAGSPRPETPTGSDDTLIRDRLTLCRVLEYAAERGMPWVQYAHNPVVGIRGPESYDSSEFHTRQGSLEWAQPRGACNHRARRYGPYGSVSFTSF